MKPQNPYYVLDVSPDATPGEFERQGRKLLALFDVGAEKAKTYTCALGTFARDATMVREAMTSLRDPKQRAMHACLASLILLDDSVAGSESEPDAPLAEAFLAGGYRGL